MSTIMVQVTDHSHTLAALHSACDLARETRDDVVLVKLISVNHPSWLGTDDLGYLNLTDADSEMLRGYQREAESRGVNVGVCCLQSISSAEAVVWAAECVEAKIVFARLPHTVIPFWHRWQVSSLRHRLAQRQCQLFLEDEAAPQWLPVPQPTAVHS